ncbi:MAG: FixH family protein [Deltaproteobacteria bacterium]|nr:FixH family protein [Deltaproteobacteria bacterium]
MARGELLSWPGVLAIVLAACACLEPPPVDEGPVSIASVSDGELSLELLVRGSASLRAGRNTILLALRDEASDEPVRAATITQAWQMTMPEMTHGCPARNPITGTTDDGRYPAAVLRPRASSTTATWSNRVSVATGGGAEHLLVFTDLPVAPSDRAITLEGADGASYLVTLSFAEGTSDNHEPALGANPYILTVHEASSALSYAPVSDAALQVSADMPAMGHGADTPPPSYDAEGEYVGAMELAMAGAWRVSFALSRAGVPLGVAAFDLSI